MRVLAYVHAYSGHGREAGAETTLHDILRFLVSLGWEVDVLLSQGNWKPYTLDGVNVRCETGKKDLLGVVDSYDILISHLECSKRLALVSRQIDKPMVHLVHNTMSMTVGYLGTKTELAIYNSNWVKDFHEGNEDTTIISGERKNKVTAITWESRRCWSWPSVVVHPPVDPERYATDSSREYITMVNFFTNKGPEIFWKIVANNPDKKFLAVKGGYGEQEIPDILPENVTVMENVLDPREFYSKTKLILMPSDYESYGRIAVEALASGIPSVVHETRGLREALGDAGTYVTTRKDISQWQAAIDGALSDYPRLVEAAQERSEWLWKRTERQMGDLAQALGAII